MHAPAKKALLAAACCLMIGAVAAADLDPVGDIKAQAEKFVKVDNPEYLAGIKRVVITNYMVDFVSELKYTKSLSGLEAMIGADSDVTIKLIGSNNELQALSEFAELATFGITPVPRGQYAKSGTGMFISSEGQPQKLSDEMLVILTFIQSYVNPNIDNLLTFDTHISATFWWAKGKLV